MLVFTYVIYDFTQNVIKIKDLLLSRLHYHVDIKFTYIHILPHFTKILIYYCFITTYYLYACTLVFVLTYFIFLHYYLLLCRHYLMYYNFFRAIGP